MATIKVRRRANGSIRYIAIVHICRGTTIVHRESRTFTHRSAAQSWDRHHEVVLEDPAEVTRQRQCTSTLAELIRWYIDTFETISRRQRSKQTHLEFLERHALGKTMAHTPTSADLIRNIQSRRAESAWPATVINSMRLCFSPSLCSLAGIRSPPVPLQARGNQRVGRWPAALPERASGLHLPARVQGFRE
jgi:hypothetical protein